MKILLIGDCSGVHSTLAKGLRSLGHEVCVASDGGGWRNFPRDISITRNSKSKFGGVLCMMKAAMNLHKMKGFDVVQVIHCPFFHIRAKRTLPFFRFLRKHNKKIFMGAYGTDHYYVKACLETDTYRYSDFTIADRPMDTPFNRADIEECMHGGTLQANQEIAKNCNGIIACLWEYYVAYKPHFPDKTSFIPLPIDIESVSDCRVRSIPDKVNFFVGIQSERAQIKGIDVMFPVLQEVQKKYPKECSIEAVTDLPFDEYQKRMNQADVVLDQLYSYTPAVNALVAMAKGIVVVSGGEPENYEIINEQELRPIINITPSKEDVYQKLEDIVLHKERIPELSAQSIEYVKRHHDHIKVAQQYLDFWNSH